MYQSDLTKVTRTRESNLFPEVLLIDNCSACNLECTMCDHKNIRKFRTIQLMDFDLYTKIIDEIASENPKARVWEIFFGDPFICKDMPKRIRYAKDRGLQDIVLNTNGVLMTPEKAQAIIEAGLDALYVGIDAVTEETYNKIRIKGDFHKVVKNILSYRDLLAKLGRKGQQLYVQYVVSETNEHELDAFKTFWKKEGIHTKIRPKVSWGGLVEAKNLRQNENVQRKACYWLMRSMSICADGEVALCAVDVHCRVKCGSVKAKSIKEIWQGELGAYRRLQAEGKFNELPGICKNCRDWQSTYAEFVD